MSSLKANLKAFLHTSSTPRVLLFIPAVLLKLVSAALSGAAYVLNSGPLFIAGMVFWVLWIATLFLIALPQTDRLLARVGRWLKPVSMTLLLVLVVAGLLESAAAIATSQGAHVPDFAGPNTSELLNEQLHNLTYNDGTALCHQAIDNLMAGGNPYAEANIITANLRFGNPSDKTTPIQTGRFAGDFPYPTQEELKAVWDDALKTGTVPPEIESRLNYPAGCFLLPAPLIWLGIGDLRWVYLIAIVLGVAYAVARARADMRLWLLGAALASLEIWQSIASGETGTLVFPFLLGAWLLWRRNMWLSAICMGVAVATKQVAWFFLPFYLILVLRNLGWKRTASSVAIIGGVFLAFNIAFIVQGPGLWVSSVMAPMLAKFFPLGVGPVTLVISGYIKTQSSLVFSLMEIMTMLAGIIWYWRNCRRYPHMGIILAVVPLFFAWRSSWWYFFYFDIMLLAVIIIEDYGKAPLLEPS